MEAYGGVSQDKDGGSVQLPGVVGLGPKTGNSLPRSLHTALRVVPRAHLCSSRPVQPGNCSRTSRVGPAAPQPLLQAPRPWEDIQMARAACLARSVHLPGRAA